MPKIIQINGYQIAFMKALDTYPGHTILISVAILGPIEYMVVVFTGPRSIFASELNLILRRVAYGSLISCGRIDVILNWHLRATQSSSLGTLTRRTNL